MEDERPKRQIVLCLDGTNNTLTGGQRDTNVLRLYQHLRAQARPDQLLYYDPGVGAPVGLASPGLLHSPVPFWERVKGLAFGRGVEDNIAEAYGFLMQHWQPGDQIYLFGFSRGAFTARAVAGMVSLFGILKPEHQVLVPTLISVYFSPPGQRDKVKRRQRAAQWLLGVEQQAGSVRSRAGVASQVRRNFSASRNQRACAHFIGVWDTVERVGFPPLEISSTATIRRKRMGHVRHALSLDEHRHTFSPRLYSDADFGGPNDAQSLRQRWFPGAHADVGGGYAPAQSGLAQEALRWMLDEAITCGLRCPPMVLPPAQRVAHDQVHTSPWWALTGLTVRDTRGPGHRAASQAQPAPGVQALQISSVWSQVRSRGPLLLAVLGLVLAWWCHVHWLRGVSVLDADLRAGWSAASRMAEAQLFTLVEWLLGTWQARWKAAPHAGWLGWAFAADAVIIASYTYLLGRWFSWGYTRLAGWRLPGQTPPWWRKTGRALQIAVAGDVVENLMTWVALDGHCPPTQWWQAALLWVGSLGSLAKWAGLIGCVLVGALGAFARKRAA